MDENNSSGSGSPPSAAPREPPRPATRPPAPPTSPSFENHAFQPDETDCAPRHDHNIAQNGEAQNGDSKHLSQNGTEQTRLPQNGETKNGTKMSDPNHNGNQLNNESFGVNNGKVDTPVDVKEKSGYEAVNLELVNIAPKNGGMNKDNMLPAKKDVRVDISTNAYDEYFVPVNQHRKFMRGEKLYVTADKRKRGGCQRPLTWTLGLVLLVAAILIITLAATGVIFKTPATPVNGTEAGEETTPMSPFNLPSHANRTLTNVTETRHSMHNVDAVADNTTPSPSDGYLENTNAPSMETSPEPSSEPVPEPEPTKIIIEPLAEPNKTEPIPEPTREPDANESSPEPTSEPAREPAVNDSSPEPTSEPKPATDIQPTEPVSEPAPAPIVTQYVPVVISEPIPEPTTTSAPEEPKPEPVSEPVVKEEVMPEANSEPTSEPSPSETSSKAQPESSPEPVSLDTIPGNIAEPTSEPVAQETTTEASNEPSAEPATNDNQNMEDNSLNVVGSVNATTTTEEPKSSSIVVVEEPSPMPTTSQPDQMDVMREDKQLDHSILVVGPVDTTTIKASEMITETVSTSGSSASEGQVNIVVPSSPEESGNADQGVITMTTTDSSSSIMEATSVEPFVSSILVDGSQTINMADSNALDVEIDTKPPIEEEPTPTTTQGTPFATGASHLLFPNSPASSETEMPQQPQAMTSTSESSINMAPEVTESTSEEPTESPNIISGISDTTMENKLDVVTKSETTDDLSNRTEQEMATHGPIMLTEILHQYEVTEPSEETSMPQEIATVAPQMAAMTEISISDTPVSEDNVNSVTNMPSSSSEMEMGRGFISNDYPQIIMETSTSSESKSFVPLMIPTLPTIEEETTVADIASMTEEENSVTMKIDNISEAVVENAEMPKAEVEETTVMDMSMVTEPATMAPEKIQTEAKDNDMSELKTTVSPPTTTSTESTSNMVSSEIIISEVSKVNEDETNANISPVTTTEKAADHPIIETTVQPIVASSTEENVSVTDNEVSPGVMGSTSVQTVEDKVITNVNVPESTTQSVEEAIKQFNEVITAEINNSNAVQPMEKTTSEAITISPLIDTLTQNVAIEILPNNTNTEMPSVVEEDLKLPPVETTTGMKEVMSASSTIPNMEASREETTTQSANMEDVIINKSETPMASTEVVVQNETSTATSNEMLNRELGDPVFDIIAHLTTTVQPSTTTEAPQEITSFSTEAKILEPTTETMEQAEKDIKETLKENPLTVTPILSTQQAEITSEMPVELVSSTEMREFISSTEISSQETSKDVTGPPTEPTTVTNEETKSSQDTDATTTTEAVKETSLEQIAANVMNIEAPSKSPAPEMDKEVNTEVPDSTETSDDSMNSATTDELLSITTSKGMISSSIDSLQTETSTESQTIAFDGSKDLVANTPEVTFRIANFSCQSAITDPLPLISKLEGLLTKAIISDVGEDNEENKVVRVTDLRPGGIVTYSIQWTPKPGTNTIFNTIPQEDLTELNDYLRTNNRLLGDFLVPDDARETTKYDFSTCQDDNLTGNDIFEDSLKLYPGSKEEASPLKV